MYDTPLPGIVLAMITCGLPLQLRARSAVAMNSAMSLPSHSKTSQLNARYFLRKRLERHHVLGAAVDLDEVTIDDCGEVVQFELRAGQHRFPMQTALVLRIRRNDPDVKVLAVHLRSKRHADALREAFTQRAGGRLDRGKRHAFWVPLKTRAELTQRQQLLDRKIPEVGHRRVTDRRNMSAREQQAIAIGPLRIGWVVSHQMPVERRKDVRHVQRSGRMPRTGRQQRANDALADVVGLELQLGQVLGGKAYAWEPLYQPRRAGPYDPCGLAGQGVPWQKHERNGVKQNN